MSSGGGKGGESKQELDPEMKAMARKVFARGEALSKANPVPYTGLTMAAPSASTKNAWAQKNNAANLLGVGVEGNPADQIMMKEKTDGEMTGFSAHDYMQQTMKNAWEEYPERMQQLNQLIPGLMNLAKSHQTPGQPGSAPQVPQYTGMPDYSQIAAYWRNRGGMGR